MYYFSVDIHFINDYLRLHIAVFSTAAVVYAFSCLLVIWPSVKLGALHRMIGHDIPERLTYVHAALKWSGETSELKCKLGHPKLHQKFAWTFWRGLQLLFSRPLSTLVHTSVQLIFLSSNVT